MPRRFPGSAITVSLSTSGSLMPGWMAEHMAASAGIGGIDLDATSLVGLWLATRASSKEHYVPVRSVWVPFLGRQSPRVRLLIDTLRVRQPGRPPLVVATIPVSATMRGIVRDLDTARATWDPGPLAIGLTSGALRGGRPHLVQLGGLRHVAEEWDVSVAIDLAGRFDPTWEAEAAIARVGARLSLLRLRSSAPSRAAIGSDRVACRALHAAIDRGQNVQVALTPARSVVTLATPRASARSVELAAEYVADRAAVHAAALREGIDHFEGTHLSRGT